MARYKDETRRQSSGISPLLCDGRSGLIHPPAANGQWQISKARWLVDPAFNYRACCATRAKQCCQQRTKISSRCITLTWG